MPTQTRATKYLSLLVLAAVALWLVGSSQAVSSAGSAVAGRTISWMNLSGEWYPRDSKTANFVTFVADYPAGANLPTGQPGESMVVAGWINGQPEHRNGFERISLWMSVPRVLPAGLTQIAVWSTGTPAEMTLAFQLTDADGQPHRLVADGSLRFTGWRQVAAEVQTDWPQPLTLEGVVLQAAEGQAPVRIRTQLAGLTATLGQTE